MIGDRVKRLSQLIAELRPDFGRELANAGLDSTPVEYVSKSVYYSCITSLSAFALTHALYILAGRGSALVSFSVSALVFLSCALYFGLMPDHLVKSRARRIEESLVYSLHALNIELESGVRFGSALEHVAERGYGEFSREMGWVITRASKYGLGQALRESASRNPSRLYSRAVWQVLNSLDTGADMKAGLRAVIEDLRKRQEAEAQRYGRSMERKMVVYVVGAIVFPALSVVVIQTVSGLGLAGESSGARPYLMVLFFSILVQLFFIYMVRSSKPSLLVEFQGSGWNMNPVRGISAMLMHAGVASPAKYLAGAFLGSCLFGLVSGYFASGYFSVGLHWLWLVFSGACLLWLVVGKAYKADERGLAAAQHLPDSLRITAANIRAGLPIDQSLFMSAREDFPVLGEELRALANDVSKNVGFEEAVRRMGARVRNTSLHMSLNLIVHGLRSGSGLSDCLYHIADILQEREHIRQEVATCLHSVKTTVLILVMFSAPILYGFSYVSSEVMSSLHSKLTGGLPESITAHSWLKGGGSMVEPGFLDGFILASLFVTSFLGCVTVGAVSTGRLLGGLTYFFPIVLVSGFFYAASKAVLYDVMGGVFALA